MRFSVDAVVDGRRVHTSTLWKTRFIDGWPSGGRVEARGSALVLPIAENSYVYGLFNALNGDMIEGWSVLPTGLDVFVSDEDRHLGRPTVPDTSRALFRNYVIERLKGRQITFCLPRGTGLAGQDRCPIFVFYKDLNDPNSLVMVRPGVATTLNGHSIRITRVSFTFEKAETFRIERDERLPSFTNAFDTKAGQLPEGLVTDGSRQLYGRDFRSDK
ncbi:hypothetical protein FHT00_000718 [Sphingomonas insulae]|uniref:hypothetical protein n=1 Tax=Sphingomonas insulae TaxID=424800 RepID=UPI0013D68C9D|nr:hypothetical protein [Sphingomonas insulae]NIJ28790.1 hypothetical protein [Sphingomonas insulae]